MAQPRNLVVVVEDNDRIRLLLTTQLQARGFEVRGCSSSDAALAEIAASAARICGLVTDIWLGFSTMSGWDVAQRAVAAAPGLAVIYLSGGTGAEWGERGVANSCMLHKPVRMAVVADTLEQMLRGTP